MDLSSAFLWSISGITSLAYCCYDRYSREKYGASLQYSVLGFFSRRNKNAWLDLLNLLDFLREMNNEDALELDEQECVNKILLGINIIFFALTLTLTFTFALFIHLFLTFFLESNLITIEYLSTDREGDRHEATMDDGMKEIEPSFSVSHTGTSISTTKKKKKNRQPLVVCDSFDQLN